MDLLGFSVCSLSNAAESKIRPSVAGAVSVDARIDLDHSREVALDMGTYNFSSHIFLHLHF